MTPLATIQERCRTTCRQLARWLLRGVKLAIGFIAFYLAYLLVGLIPLNAGQSPAVDGTVVYIASSAIHADIIVPIRHADFDWTTLFLPADFAADTSRATHYAIGWGDRGFYLDTPTWADLKASTALRAMLLPSDSVMHVSCTVDQSRNDSVSRIVLTDTQYVRLCKAIRESLAVDERGAPRQIKGRSYHDYDAFYEARGAYHGFNTCNSWVGRRLHDAGAPVPLFTPLPGEPTLYLD